MQVRAIAYSPFWRVVTAALLMLSRGAVLAIAAALLFFETPLGNPLRLLRTFVVSSLAPGLAAMLLARAFAAVVSVANGVLTVRRRDQRVEIPCDAIARIVPWTVPLPGGGVWLGLRSGRRFPYGLQTSDPVALIEAIAGGGAPDETREAAQGLAARYASSRPAGPRRWYPPILKFVVFALVPALPLFRLHQWVAYGGTFGEYYTYGLRAYLLGFAVYWSTCAIYLVSYAAVLRAGVELAVFATAWAAPGRVAAVRRAAEIVQRLAYYSGVSVFLLGVALSTT